MATGRAPSGTASASTAVSDHSRPSSRHHNRSKKGSDPFLTRSLTAEVGNLLGQPFPGRAGNDAQHDDPSSLLADLVTTPLNMISFIFSLVLIDRQQRQWRLSQHNSDATAGWSRAWLGPEPYQASSGPGPMPEGAAFEKGSATTYSGWYPRKKKRAMAKLAVSDALEMRKRVLFALLVWSSLMLWAISYMLRCVYGWLRYQ